MRRATSCSIATASSTRARRSRPRVDAHGGWSSELDLVAPGAALVAGTGEGIEAGEKTRWHLRWSRSSGHLRLGLGKRTLAGGQVGGRASDTLDFVLARALRGLGFSLQLRERGRALLEVGLSLRHRLFARGHRA